MNVAYPAEQLGRFLQALNTVGKEATVLAEVRGRLSRFSLVTAAWVSALKDHPEQADMVESFAAKCGRLQDTTGDKLLPLFLRLVGEKTGTAIDNLNRSERLGLVPDAVRWLEMRALYNQLVHEYMEDPMFFAGALNRANELADDLFATYRNVWRYCAGSLRVDVNKMPSPELSSGVYGKWRKVDNWVISLRLVRRFNAHVRINL